MSRLWPLLAALRIIGVNAVSSPPYVLLEAYNPSNFFDGFDFYSAGDPTHGFVQYVNQSYAESAGLVATSSTTARISVDSTNVFSPTSPGRPSVRISSKTAFTRGLVILDLNHMPEGCGTWPAFWSFGPDWPNNGEIDIIEGVNQNTENLFSLHTSDNCTVAGAGQTGTLLTNNCFWQASQNVGCGTIAPASTSSFGAGFNANGGGIFAMEWTSEYIQSWFFSHSAVPPSILAGAPDPSAFGTPTAIFAGSCDIDSHFADHNLIFDTTLCGDWAGNVHAQSTCPMTSGQGGMQSCIDFVAANPAAFEDAYWEINSLNLYQAAGVEPGNGMPSGTVETSTSLIVTSSTLLSSVTPAASTASPQTSIVSAGMGVPSSSSIASSSLVLPPSSATRSKTTGPVTSTYLGPNTETTASRITSRKSTSRNVSQPSSSTSSKRSSSKISSSSGNSTSVSRVSSSQRVTSTLKVSTSSMRRSTSRASSLQAASSVSSRTSTRSASPSTKATRSTSLTFKSAQRSGNYTTTTLTLSTPQFVNSSVSTATSGTLGAQLTASTTADESPRTTTVFVDETVTVNTCPPGYVCPRMTGLV